MYMKDIRVIGDDGKVEYEGPPFVRCEEYGCRKIVPSAQIALHGACVCGGRKMKAALVLLPEEIEGLKSGEYLLNEWEAKFVLEELCGTNS